MENKRFNIITNYCFDTLEHNFNQPSFSPSLQAVYRIFPEVLQQDPVYPKTLLRQTLE